MGNRLIEASRLWIVRPRLGTLNNVEPKGFRRANVTLADRSAMTDHFRWLLDVSDGQSEWHHQQREYRAAPKDIHVGNQDRVIQDGLTDPPYGLALCGYQQRTLGNEELCHPFEGVRIAG